MFVLFRCSAGGNHGWGNIKRLELIYRALKKKNFFFQYKFVIDSNTEVKNYLKSKKINFISINNKSEDQVLKTIGPVDLSILELLHCSKKIQVKYKKISKKLIILDDITKKKYVSDILISCQKKYFKINKDKKCKFYNDYSYFPLTSNFDKYIKKRKKISADIKSIVIFIGGSNYLKKYISLAKDLSKTIYEVTFLIGSENSQKISKKIKEISKKFKVKIDSKNIPKIIFDSDVVISGGGYTKIEVAYLKTPVLCMPIHKHQNQLIYDFYNTFQIDKKFQINLNKKNLFTGLKYLNYKNRLKLSNNFSKKFIKNGIYKILKIIDEKI